MHSLPVFVRLGGETVLVMGYGDIADAKRRLVERAGAVVTANPLAAARMAFVAIEDRAEAEAVAGILKGRGMLVNVADQPDLCDFTLPAIVDRDPVIVAVGTGGQSAGLAKAIRQRLEAVIPPSLGTLARQLYDKRDAIKQRWPAPEERRRAIDAALSPGGILDAFGEESDARFQTFLDGTVQSAGRIIAILLTSDDPDEMTLRTARLLGEADEVWHLPDIAPAILHRARADAKRVPSMTPPPEDAASGERIILWLTQN